MLRKHARQRREYLRKKSVTERLKSSEKLKENLNGIIKFSRPSKGLMPRAIHLYNTLKYDIQGTSSKAVPDEYEFAGCEDPKIMITTSHDPSSRLKIFVKELRLIFPNAQQMNRGNYQINSIMHACRANNVTDFIIVHEHRGTPDSLVICHLPYGPTAFFNISDVVMRHDIPDIGPMTEQKPHLIFHNFKSDIGVRTMKILKYLFPVPKEKSQRVISFINNDDQILFRHHRFENIKGDLDLKEIGPRFQLKLYQIKLGSLDNIRAANTEWAYRPYLNTSSKRHFISADNGILKS
ncbi:U3 small nucleolar ribonucleoprotein protein IMP4 [Scaptodrosophila lebanonensis]|uniref:U3 small nucleolar ribonucleoprotein protein IMP4 n=1 Tax=Drosophila lebanonensis TaxID=7225 RepID=A0A6J2TYI8_DROLE|nr:U3 small nucleolar ribonucleoprotein protein IMP4 [Scaptodrosophila lebanonensis]